MSEISEAADWIGSRLAADGFDCKMTYRDGNDGFINGIGFELDGVRHAVACNGEINRESMYALLKESAGRVMLMTDEERAAIR